VAAALRAAASSHLGGDFAEIGKAYDRLSARLQSLSSVDPDVAVAVDFLDGWYDSSNHDWGYYEPLLQSDWPQLGLSLADCIEQGLPIDDRVRTQFTFSPRQGLWQRTHAAVRSPHLAPMRWITIGALAGAWGLGMLNFWNPVIRFASPLANTLAFGALQVIPLALLIFAITRGPWWARLLWSLVLLPIAGLTGLLGCFAAIESASIARSGVDTSFERMELVPLTVGYLASYRTNGGAMTSFGVIVRQECRILPGVLRVRRVWGVYPAFEVHTELLSPDRARFSSPAYGDRRPTETVAEVRLMPLWCPGQ
jgi:hypothetical protein